MNRILKLKSDKKVAIFENGHFSVCFSFKDILKCLDIFS